MLRSMSDTRTLPTRHAAEWLALALLSAACLALPRPAQALSDAEAIAAQRTIAIDRSGKARKGKASYYHHSFTGRKMADGTPFRPNANNAASKTLPLGTIATVTNLENGRSAVVEIRDRGPYVDGRIVDVSPSTAEQLGMRDEGVVAVEVAPIALPLKDGTVKAGAGSQVADAHDRDSSR
jgi:rare lipoprotein A